jgi:chaperonin GroEL
MSKALLYAPSVRAGGTLHTELLKGVEQLALAVGSTLGPRGRHVIIDRAGDTPLVTKDGVTVARNIQLIDPVHNAAVKMIQAVSRATVDEAGDGTTTAAVLAHAIYRRGLALVHNGFSPVGLQRAIGHAVSLVSKAIQSSRIDPSDDQIAQVATIATNGNSAIGELIRTAIQKVGRDGVITLDDSKTPDTWLEVRDGFRLESGFTDPIFITDPQRGRVVLENPLILITERLLSQGLSPNPVLHDPGPLLRFVAGYNPDANKSVREKRPLLIVAEGVVGDAMQVLIANHRNLMPQVCVVRAPGFGELRRSALSDLAMATGGKVLTADGGQTLSNWVFDAQRKFTDVNLGQCTRAIITNGSAVLEGCMGDKADPDLIPRFASSLRQQALEMVDPGSREALFHRAARLTGSVAVIRVGAHTEAEARALRDAAEDAVLAVRAALAEGIVPGGGLCLYGLSFLVENIGKELANLEAHEAFAMIAECMREPMRQIAINAGADPEVICKEVRERAETLDGKIFMGYDASNGAFVDLVKEGIVDPAKVVRVALEKASSIAALLLTSSCLVYFDPDGFRPPSSTPTAGPIAERLAN